MATPIDFRQVRIGFDKTGIKVDVPGGWPATDGSSATSRSVKVAAGNTDIVEGMVVARNTDVDGEVYKYSTVYGVDAILNNVTTTLEVGTPCLIEINGIDFEALGFGAGDSFTLTDPAGDTIQTFTIDSTVGTVIEFTAGDVDDPSDTGYGPGVAATFAADYAGGTFVLELDAANYKRPNVTIDHYNLKAGVPQPSKRVTILEQFYEVTTDQINDPFATYAPDDHVIEDLDIEATGTTLDATTLATTEIEVNGEDFSTQGLVVTDTVTFIAPVYAPITVGGATVLTIDAPGVGDATLDLPGVTAAGIAPGFKFTLTLAGAEMGPQSFVAKTVSGNTIRFTYGAAGSVNGAGTLKKPDGTTAYTTVNDSDFASDYSGAVVSFSEVFVPIALLSSSTLNVTTPTAAVLTVNALNMAARGYSPGLKFTLIPPAGSPQPAQTFLADNVVTTSITFNSTLPLSGTGAIKSAAGKKFVAAAPITGQVDDSTFGVSFEDGEILFEVVEQEYAVNVLAATVMTIDGAPYSLKNPTGIAYANSVSTPASGTAMQFADDTSFDTDFAGGEVQFNRAVADFHRGVAVGCLEGQFRRLQTATEQVVGFVTDTDSLENTITVRPKY
jgi:hypothetical protein